MVDVSAVYYDVRIGWKDNRGYVETSRYVMVDEECKSAMDAIILTHEWSDSCPRHESWLHVSATRKGGD